MPIVIPWNLWIISSIVCQQLIGSRRWSFSARYVWGTFDTLALFTVLLIGYGASAVNPYLAFETIHDQVRQVFQNRVNSRTGLLFDLLVAEACRTGLGGLESLLRLFGEAIDIHI